jgi:probable addiction module antidote protein
MATKSVGLISRSGNVGLHHQNEQIFTLNKGNKHKKLPINTKNRGCIGLVRGDYWINVALRSAGSAVPLSDGVPDRRSHLTRSHMEINMSKRITVAELRKFDAAAHIDDGVAIAAHLTDILQTNDSRLLSTALGDIARAHGIGEIAKAAGLSRQGLHKAFRSDSDPRFDTVSRVCTALGVRLVVRAVQD